MKAFILSSPDKKIHFLSRAFTGKQHDYSILKEVFDPSKPWFKPFEVRMDLGYQGFAKDYVCKKCSIPHKRKPKTELTEQQKEENKQLASERVAVEHSFGGMKRFRLLSDRLRLHDLKLYDTALEVCAGLWNFMIDTTI